jgi:capsular polysaccharide biosynthesis protein
VTVVQDDFRTQAPLPPRDTNVWRAMLWNWWVVLISVVLFVGAGAGLALLRTPTYTATARLAVGRIDITSPGALSGYAVATQSLATGYSRTVTALAVAKPVSAKTGISVKDVQSHVTATPVPESPVFRVEGTAPNADQAKALANESSRALIHYAAQLNQDNPDTNRLYRQYKAAFVQRKLAKQQLNIARTDAGIRPSPKAEEEVDAARSEVEAASLRVDAIGKAYTASVQGQVATQLIQVISPATEASSDRRSTFMIYTFIGLVIGLLVGAAIAFIRETRWNISPAG